MLTTCDPSILNKSDLKKEESGVVFLPILDTLLLHECPRAVALEGFTFLRLLSFYCFAYFCYSKLVQTLVLLSAVLKACVIFCALTLSCAALLLWYLLIQS